MKLNLIFLATLMLLLTCALAQAQSGKNGKTLKNSEKINKLGKGTYQLDRKNRYEGRSNITGANKLPMKKPQ
jgi:hypothetical protein